MTLALCSRGFAGVCYLPPRPHAERHKHVQAEDQDLRERVYTELEKKENTVPKATECEILAQLPPR